MKNYYKIITIATMCWISLIITGCDIERPVNQTKQDVARQQHSQDKLSSRQTTPTDINYSLERYNLIKRAYWVNGQREKALALPCQMEKPLGYIVLITNNGAILGRFIVDGKVTSLNSFLTPNYIEKRESYNGSPYVINTELADIDGSYGENDKGIFFFTPDGKYIEWTGTYLYSDIPFTVDAPVLLIGETK